LCKCLRELERCVEFVEIVDNPLLKSVTDKQVSVIEGLDYLVATDCHLVVSQK
jgi:hypothetical protein